MFTRSSWYGMNIISIHAFWEIYDIVLILHFFLPYWACMKINTWYLNLFILILNCYKQTVTCHAHNTQLMNECKVD